MDQLASSNRRMGFRIKLRFENSVTTDLQAYYMYVDLSKMRTVGDLQLKIQGTYNFRNNIRLLCNGSGLCPSDDINVLRDEDSIVVFQLPEQIMNNRVAYGSRYPQTDVPVCASRVPECASRVPVRASRMVPVCSSRIPVSTIDIPVLLNNVPSNTRMPYLMANAVHTQNNVMYSDPRAWCQMNVSANPYTGYLPVNSYPLNVQTDQQLNSNMCAHRGTVLQDRNNLNMTNVENNLNVTSINHNKSATNAKTCMETTINTPTQRTTIPSNTEEENLANNTATNIHDYRSVMLATEVENGAITENNNQSIIATLPVTNNLSYECANEENTQFATNIDNGLPEETNMEVDNIVDSDNCTEQETRAIFDLGDDVVIQNSDEHGYTGCNEFIVCCEDHEPHSKTRKDPNTKRGIRQRHKRKLLRRQLDMMETNSNILAVVNDTIAGIVESNVRSSDEGTQLSEEDAGNENSIHTSVGSDTISEDVKGTTKRKRKRKSKKKFKEHNQSSVAIHTNLSDIVAPEQYYAVPNSSRIHIRFEDDFQPSENDDHEMNITHAGNTVQEDNEIVKNKNEDITQSVRIQNAEHIVTPQTSSAVTIQKENIADGMKQNKLVGVNNETIPKQTVVITDIVEHIETPQTSSEITINKDKIDILKSISEDMKQNKLVKINNETIQKQTVNIVDNAEYSETPQTSSAVTMHQDKVDILKSIVEGMKQNKLVKINNETIQKQTVNIVDNAEYSETPQTSSAVTMHIDKVDILKTIVDGLKENKLVGINNDKIRKQTVDIVETAEYIETPQTSGAVTVHKDKVDTSKNLGNHYATNSNDTKIQCPGENKFEKSIEFLMAFKGYHITPNYELKYDRGPINENLTQNINTVKDTCAIENKSSNLMENVDTADGSINYYQNLTKTGETLAESTVSCGRGNLTANAVELQYASSLNTRVSTDQVSPELPQRKIEDLICNKRVIVEGNNITLLYEDKPAITVDVCNASETFPSCTAPTIGDIILFSFWKMNEDITPAISKLVCGQIIGISENRKVKIMVLIGTDEFKHSDNLQSVPEGGYYTNNINIIINNGKIEADLFWDEVINPQSIV